MSEDVLLLLIVALLPVSSFLLVLQTNPYRGLVIRGVLGAIAALTYTLFGAADIALTEALMGTMLSVTLYAIAVRSSMTMKIGVLESDESELDDKLRDNIQAAISRYHLRLEVLSYSSPIALKTALRKREIHTLYLPDREPHLHTRVSHLYRILQAALPSTAISYIEPAHLTAQADLLLETL